MRPKSTLGVVWIAFAVVMIASMFLLPGEETIPYHLVWASFALLYGLFRWQRRQTRVAFAIIVVVTGIPLVEHAISGVIGWEECSEIVLMAFIVGLGIWHVDRHRSASDRVAELTEADRERVRKQELATRSGSHEVLTRLTIARGLVELIRAESANQQSQSDADVVIAELDKAAALASEVLTLVRYDSPGAVQLVDIDELLRRIVKRWSAAAVRQWQLEGCVGSFWVDPERLEAALDALLENAVRFSEVGSAIEINGICDAGQLTLSVRDHGSGIPQTDLHTIFEVFQTGSNAGARGGSGLGLAIVAAAVKARGGSVDVASIVGVGTTFSLRLPCSPGMQGPSERRILPVRNTPAQSLGAGAAGTAESPLAESGATGPLTAY